jgi:ElaB/YqjD/DUF883 family membrane-anchored ribosome-binding protein
MDDQNKSLNERRVKPVRVPERSETADERTAEIRSNIEETRADMSETIDAIQEKLRPGHIVSQATETVRNATVGKVKDMARSARETFGGGTPDSYGVGDRIRDNAIPLAVAAASVAWIAFTERRPRRASEAVYGPARREEARERVRQATSSAQNGAQRLVRENPLAAAAIAAAVGATVGLALPATHPENQLMGEARDVVVNRVQEAARGAAEAGHEAAHRVKDAATEATSKAIGAD